MNGPLVALVTGAAGGLGRAVCGALYGLGMDVVVADLDGDRASEVAQELREARQSGSASTQREAANEVSDEPRDQGDQGERIRAAALDVTSAQDVEVLVAGIVERRGHLDVVVNLAGVIRNQVLVKIEDADFDLVIATHLRGTLNTMRAVLPHMRAGGYGRVVNMSSIAARGSIAGGAYGAAKGAIEGLTRSAAMESARHGITINCVAPGLIAAGVFLTVPEDYQRQSAAGIPMGRLGTAEEVAACIAFLASPQASYVTGQTLRICGGLSLGF